MPSHFDLIVIGGGSAGLTAATMAARMGARCMLVDRESLGGDCLHYGCVPSKSLIASARMAHRMRHADNLGLPAVEPQINFARIMDRVDEIREQIGRHESPDAMRRLGVDVALGGATFLDDSTILVDGSTTVTGKRILIATGSHAVSPEIPGLAETGAIDHVGLFKLRDLPRRLVVIGGGPVGAEMGQALSRLGSKVTIIQRAARLLPREDADISAVLQDSFEKEGINLKLSAMPVRVRSGTAGKEVEFEQHGNSQAVHCDEILVAVGRKANIDASNLQDAGIVTNARGIIVDDSLRTSNPRVFAAGDCTGGPQFTHWAEFEARIATRNALYRGSGNRSGRPLPTVTFTDPEIAHVGLTLDEARSKTGDSRVHEHLYMYSNLDRAICESDTTGMIKVVVDASDKVLGAHIVGPGAGEAMPEWVLAIENRYSLKRIGKSIHAYPTMSRINRRVADEAFLQHGVSDWINRLFARFNPAVNDAKR